MASWSSPQLSKPEKVSIPERYVDLDPEEPLSLEELQARYRKAEKIRSILTRSRLALPLPVSCQAPSHGCLSGVGLDQAG